MGHPEQSIKDALKQSPLFSNLTELQLDRVYTHSEVKSLDEGQILFTQGEDVNYFYLVFSGKVKLFRLSPDGQEKIIEIVSKGDTFAEALMFMDRPHYPVTSSALTEAVVIGIDAKKFKDMLWDSAGTCLLLLGDMSFRLRKMVKEIDALTLHTGTCRVAAYLLENVPDEQDDFELEVAKSVIAARLSVKPETFSRIIKHLKEDGVLSIDGKKIVIHDRDKLEELSLV